MQFFDKACLFVVGVAMLLVASGFLYAIGRVLLTDEMVGPPPIIFLGMFLIFAAGLTYVAVHLLAGLPIP